MPVTRARRAEPIQQARTKKKRASRLHGLARLFRLPLFCRFNVPLPGRPPNLCRSISLFGQSPATGPRSERYRSRIEPGR
jgi:hypothetical protein